MFDGSEKDAHVCIVVGDVLQTFLSLQRANPSSAIILELRESVGCNRQMDYCLLIMWQGRLFMHWAQIAKKTVPPKTMEKQRLRCQPDRSSTTNCALQTVGGPIVLVCCPFEAMNSLALELSLGYCCRWDTDSIFFFHFFRILTRRR